MANIASATTSVATGRQAADSRVTVTNSLGTVHQGVTVYAYNGATYTGYYGVTNSSGQAALLLPRGDYRFRSDAYGQQYYTSTSNDCHTPTCKTDTITIPVSNVTVTVVDRLGAPRSGLIVTAFAGTSDVGCYVFDGVNCRLATGGSGQVVIAVPAGSYRFMVQQDGLSYYSGDVNHCTTPGCTSATITVPPLSQATHVTYSYDPLQRLQGATYTGGTAGPSATATMRWGIGPSRMRMGPSRPTSTAMRIV